MKLLMAVVPADEAAKTVEAMIEAGFRVTRIATTGGWLRRENTTLLSGIEDEQLEQALDVLRRRGVTAMQSGSHSAGGAAVPATGRGIVFVMDVERFEHY
ncbi:MAG: cyclic-di-AMP receptor [Anaerolineae bacterium]|nr:cyclic-di-AMP receptor [Thermoflexales bacterium]MDW8406329.1 cyclic-di-AMP receptor [Anaerolineae bacterium]